MRGIGSLWEALGWFERLWKGLQALRGFVRLWAVSRGLERLWEALGGFIGFGWLCHALGGFGFGRLWGAFEKPRGALEALEGFARHGKALGGF